MAMNSGVASSQQPSSHGVSLSSVARQPEPQQQPQPPPLNLLEAQPQPRRLHPTPFVFVQLSAPSSPLQQVQLLNLLPQPEPLTLLETQPQPEQESPPQSQPPSLMETEPEPEPQQSQEHGPIPEWHGQFSELPPFYTLPPPPPTPHLVRSNDDDNRLGEMWMLPRSDSRPSPSQPEEGQSSSSRKRRQTSKAKIQEGKAETVDPPFPWARNSRAKIHTIDHMRKNNIRSISGKVQCKGCQEEYEIEFDLMEKFGKVGMFIDRKRESMKDRAPEVWTNPELPGCRRCGEEKGTVRPVLEKKRNTNWLFLFLGEMIGCATLAHLKYFCKHNGIHSTAAKDRLIYLAYVDLCKQLAPHAPF